MIAVPGFELPESLGKTFRKARQLEWFSVFYLASVAIAMAFVAGNSQAMKVAWIEDVLSLFPPIAFLVASSIYDKNPTHKYPYGHHRAFSIAFLCGAVALFGMGLFLLIDSSIGLIEAAHPTIGATHAFGEIFWSGWIMYGVLIYSAVPPIIMGRMKLPLAKKLHNKVLHTDADTQKADWMTALAAMLGVTGIGFGLWWADGVAAVAMSASVLKDGGQHIMQAVGDLINRVPMTVDHSQESPLIGEIRDLLERTEWVEDFEIRLREEGQVLMGEVFVVADRETDLVSRLSALREELLGRHWMLHELVMAPVGRIGG